MQTLQINQDVGQKIIEKLQLMITQLNSGGENGRQQFTGALKSQHLRFE